MGEDTLQARLTAGALRALCADDMALRRRSKLGRHQDGGLKPQAPRLSGSDSMNAMATIEQPAPVNISDLAVRMADEGVPVRAIARSLKTPSDDIYLYLAEAKDQGKIVSIPKDDWPPGQHRDTRTASLPPLFSDEDALKFRIARVFKATRIEAVLLASLLRRDQLTRQQLHEVFEQNRPGPAREPTDIKIIDVVVCKLRKKLKDHLIVIETIWAMGYLIAPESKKIAAQLLQDA